MCPVTLIRREPYSAHRCLLSKIDGTAWRKMRAQVLAEQPICAARDCNRISTEVDHIIPLQRGGSGVDRSNLQGMCKHHNASKGAKVSMAARKVRRCTGEPCPDWCAETGSNWWHL